LIAPCTEAAWSENDILGFMVAFSAGIRCPGGHARAQH
jgi:hypothetical protein